MKERGASPGSAGHAVLAAIGLISAATLLFELALLRVFSFSIWHHFAFLVVSVALLGFALAGTLLARRPLLGSPWDARAAAATALFSVAAPVAVVAVNRIPFDPTRLADAPAGFLLLLAQQLVLLVPFGAAGFAILVLLDRFAAQAGQVYGADLAGAGIGAIAAVPLLDRLGADGVPWIAAGLSAAAAFALWPGTAVRHAAAAPQAWTGARRATFGAAAVAVALALALLLPLPIVPGSGKLLSNTLLDPQRAPSARIAHTEWNALSRVDVVENSVRMHWTNNPRFTGAAPAQALIVIDGDATAPILRVEGKPGELDLLDYTLSSAAVQALHPRRVLVIGAGGGLDVLTALRHGATTVDAVEVNPGVAHVMTSTPWAAYGGGVFSRPGVALHRAEGRAFVRESKDSYDLVQLSLTDTWAAAAAGAYALSEGYLYTVEAVRDYLARLTPGGVLTTTRFEWVPPREVLRLCAVAAEALRRDGVTRPGDHTVVLALHNMGNLLVKRTPFTPDELARVREVAQARGFSIVHQPGSAPDNPMSALFASPDPSAFAAAYPFDISPSTDDSPFFFQFGRWRDAGLFGDAWREKILVLSGRLVLLAALVQAILLSAVLLVLPLRGAGADADAGAARTPSTARALVYFGLLGAGFMLLEIALMQRFTLLLGSPVLSVSVVLATLLVSAGIGSRFAPRLAPEGRAPVGLFVLIAALAVTLAAALPSIFRASLGAPVSLRVLLTVVALVPLGFLLGVPLPAGLSRVRAGGHGLVAWAWCANGCLSVIGPVLASMLAMDAGFAAVLVAGAACYLAALVVFGPWWNAAGTAGSD